MVEGEIEAGRRYGEGDFNRIIEIREREQRRVEILMSQIDLREKTLLRLKYRNSLSDAIADLGSPAEISDCFIDFQRWLYVAEAA